MGGVEYSFDDRAPSHLRHAVVGRTEDVDVGSVPKLRQRLQNRVKRRAMLKRDKSRHVLDENGPRGECLDEAKVLLEQMVSAILGASNGGVD